MLAAIREQRTTKVVNLPATGAQITHGAPGVLSHRPPPESPCPSPPKSRPLARKMLAAIREQRTTKVVNFLVGMRRDPQPGC